MTAVDSHIQSTPAAMAKATNAPAQPAAAPASAGEAARSGGATTAKSRAPTATRMSMAPGSPVSASASR